MIKGLRPETRRKQALAIKLGYYWGGLDYALLLAETSLKDVDMQRYDIAAKAVEFAADRCRYFADSLGELKIIDDAESFKLSLLEDMDYGQPVPIRAAFHVGLIVGRIYYYAVGTIGALNVPPDMRVIEILSESKKHLSEAQLPMSFLEPIRKDWLQVFEKAQRGIADNETGLRLEKLMDEITDSIRIDN